MTYPLLRNKEQSTGFPTYRFSLFDIRVWFYEQKKRLFGSCEHANWRIVTKVSPSYETETMEEAIPLIWLNIAKIFFGIMRIKFALQAV